MITGENVKKCYSSAGGPTMIREHLPNDNAPRTQGKMSNYLLIWTVEHYEKKESRDYRI